MFAASTSLAPGAHCNRDHVTPSRAVARPQVVSSERKHASELRQETALTCGLFFYATRNSNRARNQTRRGRLEECHQANSIAAAPSMPPRCAKCATPCMVPNTPLKSSMADRSLCPRAPVPRDDQLTTGGPFRVPPRGRWCSSRTPRARECPRVRRIVCFPRRRCLRMPSPCRHARPLAAPVSP